MVLCRDVYHCDPEKAEGIPAHYIIEDLAMLNMEAQVIRLKAKR